MRSLLIILSCWLLSPPTVLSQERAKDPLHGTIRVSKVKRYFFDRGNSLYKPLIARVITVRAYGCVFKEYFPEGYQSEVFPIVFNGGALIVVDENRKTISTEVLSCNYELVLGNITCGDEICIGNGARIVNQLKQMPKGSSAWISSLAYVDGNGDVQINKVGEFRIERVQ